MMFYYGLRKFTCPTCKIEHTVMCGELITFECYCPKCNPASLLNILKTLFKCK